MQILLSTSVPSDFDRRLHGIAPQANVVHARRDDPGYGEALRQAEIMLGSPRLEDLTQAAKLRWLQLPSAGADTYVGRIPEEIRLTTASGVYGIPVAEHAFALMLGVARSIPKYVRRQATRSWEEEGSFRELHGSTCGLLGLGDIGLEIARRANAFGMRVLGMRRNPDRVPEGVEDVFGPDDVEQMLRQSDFVVNSLPDTAATRGMLDGRLLRAIRKGGILVNVGRGSTVVEPALVDALREGHLFGAGLDVFEEEPLPEDSPLWDMSNVLITPHVGGISPRGDERVADLFLDNLKSFLAGGELQNRVDPDVGY